MGTCPYKVVATYDGYPIFSNTCLDNEPFYTSDGITYDPSGYYTGLRWQCVEWAERYFLFKWGVTGPNGTMPWGGIAGAKDMCEKSAAYYAERGLAKVSTPITGDLMVFNKSQCNADPTWGHVALVIGEASATHYQVAQQNAGDASSIATVPKSCAYCFIHALSNNGSTVPDETAILLTPDPFEGRQSTDVDGDGRSDVCGRAADGFRCALADGFATIDGPPLSDEDGWTDPSNFATLRMADFDGDGRADLCGRADDGFRCWPSTGDGFGASYPGPPLSDALGWNEAPFYASVRVGDIDGDARADLCVRASEGVRCWPSTGRGFAEIVEGPPLTDESGWLGVDHHATLQLGDVNGDGRDDVCARAGAGMRCWLADGAGFPTDVPGPAWSDDDGWDEPARFTTIRLRDVDGDGRADLCGRTSEAYVCHLSEGESFAPAIEGPAWSDADGWDDVSRAATIALADIDGDGDRDLCGRAAEGIRCHLWNGDGFGDERIGPDLSDDQGWTSAAYYRSIRYADVDGDGKADICARAADGVLCWPSTGRGFGEAVSGPAWSDDAGWNSASQYTTLRLAWPEVGAAESPTNPGAENPASPEPGAEDAAQSGCSCAHAPAPPPSSFACLLMSLALLSGRIRARRRPAAR